MSIEDYHSSFENTSVNIDTKGMHYAYFLKLNDQTTPNGTDSDCGSTCVRHDLSVTSEVDQTVYVEAHTWDDRQ